MFPSCDTWRMVVGRLAVWMSIGLDGVGEGPGWCLDNECLDNGGVVLGESSWAIARVGLQTALISRMVSSNELRSTESFSSKLSVVSCAVEELP